MRRQNSKEKRVLTVGVGDIRQKVRDVTKVGKVTGDIPAMHELIGELAIAFTELNACKYTKTGWCTCVEVKRYY